MAVTVAGVGIAAGLTFLIITHLNILEDENEAGMRVLVHTVGDYTVAPLVFGDAEGATEVLRRLRAAPQVTGARLYDHNGGVFAEYGTLEGPAVADPFSAPKVSRNDSTLSIVHPLEHDGLAVGVIQVESSLAGLGERARESLVLVFLLGLGVLGVCALLAVRLQRFFTQPINALVSTMETIGHEDSLTTRVHHARHDEIGKLYEGFNKMMAQVAQRQEERDRSDARLRALLNVMPDLAFLLDRDGRYVDVLAGTEELFAKPASEVLGRTVHEVLPADVAQACVEVIGAAIDTGAQQVVRYELEVPLGKRTFEALVTVVGKNVVDEGVPVVLMVSRDVTDREELELRLRQATKMEAVGQLAGGIAHDFNNLLAVIMGQSELAKMEASIAGQDAKWADEVLDASQRAADLVAQLLAFSRRGSVSRSAIDLNALMARVINMVERTVDRRIRLKTDFCTDTVVTEGDSSVLESAFLNLAINARDAMPEGGSITFGSRLVYLSGEATRTTDGSEPISAGQYVECFVTDTGTGMSEEVRRRVFEPFFTTKPVGKGTGLGLAAVYGTVKSLSGKVELDSEPGKGTTFRLYFPVRQSDVTHAVQAAEAISGHGTILIVDDEPAVAKICGAMLKQLGYDPILAGSGTEAVEIFRAEQPHVKAVVLDMVMPDMNGEQVMTELRKIDVDIPVVLASGYNLTRADGTMPHGADAFVQKPYRRATIAQAVAQVIRQDRASQERSIVPSMPSSAKTRHSGSNESA